jgi:hypothetical protein
MGSPEVVPRNAGRVDVFFAVAPGASALMPPPPGKGGGSPLRRVGLIGVPRAAADAVEAVARRSSREALGGPLGVPAGQAADLLQARGSLKACRTKLSAALAAHKGSDLQREARLRGRVRAVSTAAAVASGLFTGASTNSLLVAMLTVLAVAAAIPVLDRLPFGRLMEWLKGQGQQASEVATLLAAWERDALPQAPCRLQLDLRPASQVPAHRWALSPHSKALKSHHRHRWARVSWVSACGSPVLVEWVDRVKLRNGLEQRRQPHVRGLLVPNPQVWDVDRLPDRFKAGALAVRCHRAGDRTILSFQGAVDRPADAGPALQALYSALPRVAR